jgi:transposase
MTYVQGESRTQMCLPEFIEDMVSQDNPVRVIDSFVDSLDMQKLGFVKAQPAHTGRPAYDPMDLLKLYLYGYFNQFY